MNAAKEYKTINNDLDAYRSWLDVIPDEKFNETPLDGGWSYAEVYSHIMQATLGSCIALERCINNNCDPTTKGLNLQGRVVMMLGRFPVKVKVPQKVAAKMPVAQISKEDARNLIIKCRKRIADAMPLIKDYSPAAKHKHPRLGMLDAGQWLKFIRIHLENHLRQLGRIRKKV
jgi:hypothetical protein